MVKRVAVVQSNYIPWKGYFDLIAAVDEFILFDDVQYTRRDWRNRNLIKTPQGLKWLTIPVEVKGKFHQKICDTRISEADWGHRHWDILRQKYWRAPFFGMLQECLAGEVDHADAVRRAYFLRDFADELILFVDQFLDAVGTVHEEEYGKVIVAADAFDAREAERNQDD